MPTAQLNTCTTCRYCARDERLLGQICLRTRETRVVTSPVDGVTREEVSYTSCDVERIGRGLSALLLRVVFWRKRCGANGRFWTPRHGSGSEPGA